MSIDHIDDSDSSSDAAISYTDDFLHAAVDSIDSVFGEGYARKNPQLVGQYMIASATNLGSFMTATMAMGSSGLGEMLAAMGDDDVGGFDLNSLLAPEPAPTKAPRKKK